jgi:hypothetical protein
MCTFDRTSVPIRDARAVSAIGSAMSPRRISAAIQMRVRQEDGIDLGRFHRQGLPVPEAIPRALRQAAIDQEPPAADLEQVVRSGDRHSLSKNVSEDIR